MGRRDPRTHVGDHHRGGDGQDSTCLIHGDSLIYVAMHHSTRNDARSSGGNGVHVVWQIGERKPGLPCRPDSAPRFCAQILRPDSVSTLGVQSARDDAERIAQARIAMARKAEQVSMPAAVEWDLEKLRTRVAIARRGRDINVLSLEIGIHASSLRHVEAGELPQINALLRVCSWLGTTVDEFVR